MAARPYIAVLALASSVLAVLPASAAARSRADALLCGNLQHIIVSNTQQQSLVIKNDNYGGMPECLLNKNLGANFRVTSSAAASTTNAVMAYPEIFAGCSWGVCSPGTTLPLPISRLNQPEASWYTTQNASGRWDAAFDIWFNQTPIMTGQATGAELMIWLNARHYPVPRGTKKVWADGYQWFIQYWIAKNGGTRWHYIQFRLVKPAWQVRQLKLMPFILRAETLRWIRPQWWLLNIEAGFEIWQGGVGLATQSFWARP